MIYSPVSEIFFSNRRVENKREGSCSGPSLYCLYQRNYSPGWIASDGQTPAQVPQSTHRSGLIEYLSPSEIASDGHSSMQVPQAMQSSPITYAIVVLCFKVFVAQKYTLLSTPPNGLAKITITAEFKRSYRDEQIP